MQSFLVKPTLPAPMMAIFSFGDTAILAPIRLGPADALLARPNAGSLVHSAGRTGRLEATMPLRGWDNSGSLC